MAYLGNAPARSFISFERQVFTIVNSQTAYTLDHSVNNENDIRLVINNIVQEPGSGKAYTASGTTLTLSAALTNGTDEMYCVFLGRAVGTVNAPAGSVGTSQLVDDAVTLAKMAPGTDGNIISYDASGNPVAVATGTAGQVLTSAGAGAPPTFSTAASSDFVKITSTTVSSAVASVSLTGMDSTYQTYKIIGNDITLASSDNYYFRFINSSGDITGSSYYGVGDGAYKPYNSSDANLRYSNYNTNYGRIQNFDPSTNATNASSFEMIIPNPSNSATMPYCYGNVGWSGSNGTYMITATFAFQYTGAGAITGLKFYGNGSVNTSTGTFTLYGLK